MYYILNFLKGGLVKENMDIDASARSRKVIREAINSLKEFQNLDERFWNELCSRVQNRKGKLVLTGVGKSGYIAMKVAATLTSLGNFATFIHPVEAMHGDSGGVTEGDTVIAFSYSGNTKELIQFMRHIKERMEVSLIGVTGARDSQLGKLSDMVILITIQEEGSPYNLAPMASTTAMLVAGDALAAGLTSPQTFTKNDFARYHPSGTLGFSLTSVKERMLPHTPDDMVGEDTELQEVLLHMSNIGKGIIGVISPNGALTGAITDGDIRRFLCTNISIEGAHAKDAMNVTPKYVQHNHTLKDALEMMESFKITNVFVINEESIPIGILHMHDILSS